MTHETPPDDQFDDPEGAETEDPEEFAAEIEQDPAHNPDDDTLEEVRGG